MHRGVDCSSLNTFSFFFSLHLKFASLKIHAAMCGYGILMQIPPMKRLTSSSQSCGLTLIVHRIWVSYCTKNWDVNIIRCVMFMQRAFEHWTKLMSRRIWNFMKGQFTCFCQLSKRIEISWAEYVAFSANGRVCLIMNCTERFFRVKTAYESSIIGMYLAEKNKYRLAREKKHVLLQDLHTCYSFCLSVFFFFSFRKMSWT